MSLAQQPGSGRESAEVTRLCWALGITGLALVVALAVLASTLLSMRRASSLSTSTERRLHQPSVRMARAPRRQRARGEARVARANARTHRSPAAPQTQPRVEIVERRIVPLPVLPVARATESPSTHPAVPPPERVLGQRWTLKPPTAPPPAPAVTLPLIALPPADAENGDAATRESPPEPIARPAARYPEDAAAEGVSGSVRLKVIVGRRGRVEDAVVVRSSGDDRLDQAAAAAVRRWRYRPALRDGRAVTGVDYQVIEFSREDREPRIQG